MRKNKIKGFTLMEIIIVIAIIAVLSGVMIPSANYFIRRSKIKTANAEAKVVYNAALTVSQEYEAKNVSVTSTDKYGNPSSSVTHYFTNIVEEKKDDEDEDEEPTGAKRIEAEFIKRVNAKVKSDPNDKIVWAVYFKKEPSSTFPQLVGACAASTAEDRYVGSYPHPAETSGMSYSVLGSGISAHLAYASTNTKD